MQPQHLSSSPDTIPALETLQARPQWVCWRRERRQGNATKVPYTPRTGARARSNDPTTWGSYQEAVTACQRQPERYQGIGYMFCGDVTGIDFDHCVQEDGTIDAWAWEWIARLASYAEYSPGDGVHVLVAGTIPASLRRRVPEAPSQEATIEMYSDRHYFTITGRHLEGTPLTLETCPDVVAALYTHLNASTSGPQQREPRAAAPGDMLSDAALLSKAMEARNGAAFRALWSGNTSGYASPSEAELALCNLLAFWSGKDAARVDHLFRQSGLYRQEKWDRPARRGETYGQGTIARAIAGCHQGYTPGDAPPRSEQQKIIPFPTRRSATTPGLEQLGELPATDLSLVLACLKSEEQGDAQLYAHLFGDKCVYDHTEGAWYEWRGHFWERDECKHALLLASGPLPAVYLEASAALSEQAAQEARHIDPTMHDEETDRLKERYAWLKATTAALIERARALQRLQRALRVLTYAQALLTITSSEWDTHPWLLGTREGVLDLRAGTLRKGEPRDYLRTVIPTAWRGLDAAAPRFAQFLREIFADRDDLEREELITFLQRALGYGITGHVTEHIFLMLYGEEGRNGKDTLMSVLHHVLGSAAEAVSNDVMIASGKLSLPGAAKPHLCALQGKRIAWASETDRGARFDVGQVKFLTGGGAIPARQLYGKDYAFAPSHLLILLTNHKPHADARDAAFWDRLCPILFTLRFVDQPAAANERQRDTTLGKALEAEASGILAWLVRGCLAWQRDGLSVPASVIQARREYRGEEDTLGQFLQECCVCDPEASVKASALYERYKTWAQANTLKPLTGTAFGLDMKKRFAYRRDMRGMCYDGIRVLDESHVGLCRVDVGFEPKHYIGPEQASEQVSSTPADPPLCRVVGFAPENPHKEGGKETKEVIGKCLQPYIAHQEAQAFSPPPKPVETPSEEERQPYIDESEVGQLLSLVTQHVARLSKVFWKTSEGSGLEPAYLPREEYLRRIEACLTSDNPAWRQAALDEMRARVKQ